VHIWQLFECWTFVQPKALLHGYILPVKLHELFVANNSKAYMFNYIHVCFYVFLLYIFYFLLITATTRGVSSSF
jgi:hypothetical protein